MKLKKKKKGGGTRAFFKRVYFFINQYHTWALAPSFNFDRKLMIWAI